MGSKKVKAIFFDLDGTLCDPGSSWDEGIAAALQLFESRHPERASELKASWEQTGKVLRSELIAGRLLMREFIEQRYPRALSEVGIVDEALGSELNDCLSETRKHALRPMPGAHETLRQLRKDFHLGIITNGSDAGYADSQMATIQQIGVQDMVDAIWISDRVGSRKPDPGIFSAALEGADVSSGEAVYVGDSYEADIIGANGVGMLSILIDPMDVFEPAPDSVRPDRIIHSISDVIPIVKALA